MPGATKHVAWFYDFSDDDGQDAAAEPAKVADRDWWQPRWCMIWREDFFGQVRVCRRRWRLETRSGDLRIAMLMVGL